MTAKTASTPSPSADTRPREMFGRPLRRLGYTAGIVVSMVTLLVLHLTPGWERLPLLSPAFDQVLGLVTISIVVSIGIGLVKFVDDRARIRLLGEAVTAAIGAVVLVRLVQVFPFDVTGGWASLLRVVLVALAIASAVGAAATLGRIPGGR